MLYLLEFSRGKMSIKNPKIVSVSSLREIVFGAKNSSLLVLDIDNTIVFSKSYIGSVQWEKKLIEQFLNDGLSLEEALHKAQTLWVDAQRKTQVQASEKDITSIFSDTYNSLGCTARPPKLIDVTIKQLKNAGFSLKENTASYPILSKAYHHKGIIFCGNVSKGKALLEFFNNTSWPSQIIMIDDHLHHLEEVCLLARKNSLPFQGFLYNKHN